MRTRPAVRQRICRFKIILKSNRQLLIKPGVFEARSRGEWPLRVSCVFAAKDRQRSRRPFSGVSAAKLCPAVVILALKAASLCRSTSTWLSNQCCIFEHRVEEGAGLR